MGLGGGMWRPKSRWSAFAIHLLISLLVFLVLATIIFHWWFQGALFSAAGGWDGIKIVAAVDLVLGPILTLIVYNLAKPVRKLVKDLALIALLQLSCLLAGVYVVLNARPLAVVYVFDTFYVFNREDYRQLDVEPQVLEGFSGWAPKFFYVETPSDSAEFLAKHVKSLLNGEKSLQQRVDLYREIPVDRQALEKVLRGAGRGEKGACVRVDIESVYRNGSVCFDLDARKVRDFIPDGKD